TRQRPRDKYRRGSLRSPGRYTASGEDTQENTRYCRARRACSDSRSAQFETASPSRTARTDPRTRAPRQTGWRIDRFHASERRRSWRTPPLPRKGETRPTRPRSAWPGVPWTLDEPGCKIYIMPLFEYACRACGHHFEYLSRQGQSPTCPACASLELDKKLSV